MPYEYGNEPDFHAVGTIQLVEWVECGLVDLTDGTWEFNAYEGDDEKMADLYEVTNARVLRKVVDHYLYYEVAMPLYKEWKHQLLTRLNEVMPKYMWAYRMLADGTNPLTSEDDYYKGRTIRSDYPETLLSGNSDYVSDGTDTETERIRIRDLWEKLGSSLALAKDVDQMVIDDVADCFSGLMTVNLDAF